MTKLALLLTGLLAGAVLTTAAPAAAEPTTAPSADPLVLRMKTTNTRGNYVVCVVASTGGVDCDWDHPSPFRPRTGK